jgi:hypothetical protein
MRRAVFLLMAAAISSVVAACSQSTVFSPDLDAKPPGSRTDGGVTPPDGGEGDGSGSCTPPTHLIIEVNGSDSKLRMGWTGLGHNIKIGNGVETAVELFGCTDNCTQCRFSGPVDVPDATLNHQRCVGATHIECDSDADCTGQGTGKCRYFLGPNIDVSLSGELELCALVHFEDLASPIPNGPRSDASAVQGSVNLVTGETTLNSMNVRLYTSLLWGCGVCSNDDTLGDGQLDGICTTKGFLDAPVARNGEPCDNQGTSASGQRGSYECPPHEMNYNLGVPTQIGPLSTSDFEWTLTNDSPSCGAEPGSRCWCGLCDDPADQPCRSDSDCNGTCGPVNTTKPDACVQPGSLPFLVPAACNVNDEEHNTGTCTATLLGGPFTAPSSACFGDDGVVNQKLRAFGDPGEFDATGTSQSTIAGLACLPNSANATIATGLGLAGPAVFELPIKTTIVGGDSRSPE